MKLSPPLLLPENYAGVRVFVLFFLSTLFSVHSRTIIVSRSKLKLYRVVSDAERFVDSHSGIELNR